MSRLLAAEVAPAQRARHSPPLPLLWAAVAAAVVLHNTEEWALGMTTWIADRRWIPGHTLHGDESEFALVLALVAACVVGLSIVAVILRPPWSAELLVCVAYALLANSASHVVLSLVSWSPMPGVVSGLVVLLPLAALITRAVPPVQWSASTIAVTAVTAFGITAGAFALAALLSRLG